MQSGGEFDGRGQGEARRFAIMAGAMPPLNEKARARLPDSAFAYVDSQGQRRLPIYDEPHVRNALARFNQVAFEDEAARDRALKRLLNAVSYTHLTLPTIYSV